MEDFDSLNAALKASVIALGGSKVVGSKLWPEKDVDSAQRHLLACLNDSKAERLSPEHLLLLLKLARDIGQHIGITHILATLGYAAPQPVEPRDEAADLMRQIVENQKMMALQYAWLTALQPSLKVAA
jgi:hypothetical protein